MRRLLAALLLAPALALGQQPDCGDAGGLFGRVFQPTCDRPHVPVKVVEVSDPDDTCRAMGHRTRRSHERILGCADVGLSIDGRTGYVFVGTGAPQWLIKHEACHIRYCLWHD